jgi:cob(I)alamin adenosyltransferase
MNTATKALIDSLRAVSKQAEPIANALILDQMSAEKQHEYANLLAELSDLLHEHAESHETRGDHETRTDDD